MRNRRLLIVFCVLQVACLYVYPNYIKEIQMKAPEDHYGIVERSKFVPLNPGEVSPSGWVKRQVALSSQGLGGEKALIRKNVWRHPTTPDKPGPFGWWPYEQHAYFLDGATRLSLVAHDKEMNSELMKTFLAVAERQNKEDGYSFCKSDVWHRGWQEKDKGCDDYRWNKTGFEGMHWSYGVFLRGVLAEYEATRSPELLEMMRLHFRNYYHKGRDKSKQGKVITGQELYYNLGLTTMESMVEFLRLAKDDQIYDNAVEIFKNNEDGMVRNYLAGNYTTVCHGVVYNELTKLYAAGYLLTGNKEYLQAAESAYAFVQENHMLPNGIHSSNEFLRGIGGFKSSETCNVAAFMWSNLWLLRATGRGEYADRIERDFYNAAQRAVSWDYKTHVYLQASNRVPGVNVDKHSEYIKCHEPKCCRMNLVRILPNFIINSVMRSHDGLAIMYYIPSETETSVNGKKVKFKITTDYPFDDVITIQFKNRQPVEFPLKLRIPGWADKASLKLNGKRVACKAGKAGFKQLKSSWKAGDTIELRLPMKIEVVEGTGQILDEDGKEPFFRSHGPSKDIQGFRKGAPFAYVTRGPLLFALPIDSYAESSVALAVAETRKQAGVVSKQLPLQDGWTWAKAPIAVKAVVQDIDYKYPKRGKRTASLPEKVFKSDDAKQKTVELVPYGSTIYRLSMLPVAE